MQKNKEDIPFGLDQDDDQMAGLDKGVWATEESGEENDGEE